MDDLQTEIVRLKNEKNAVILAHTYQPGDIQDIADYVGDSYGLSVEATKVSADVIIFCGVQFMAETAKILNPSRKVILAEPDAGCPMADMITADELISFKRKHPDYLVMCYVNSTAEIKALSDVCCTSSNAVKIAKRLPSDKGILFVPDQHLGTYVQEQTGKRMAMWQGFCPTHARITPEMLHNARKQFPNALIMIHPEAPHECRELADKVFSTGQMCDFVKDSSSKEFIVATEIGILHTLRKSNPEKSFFPLNNSIYCPNMKKGQLNSIKNALNGTSGMLIDVPENIANKAYFSLKKMLELSA